MDFATKLCVSKSQGLEQILTHHMPHINYALKFLSTEGTSSGFLFTTFEKTFLHF